MVTSTALIVLSLLFGTIELSIKNMQPSENFLVQVEPKVKR